MKTALGHNPNHIPLEDRLVNVVASLFIFAYGTYGIWVDDIYVPAKRRHYSGDGDHGIHFHGVPAWIMYCGIICACVVMLSVVIDHYDRRANEIKYQQIATTFRFFGYGFCYLAMTLQFIILIK